MTSGAAAPRGGASVARLVRHDRRKPYCDRSHKRTRDAGEQIYMYDEEGRTRAVPFYPS